MCLAGLQCIDEQELTESLDQGRTAIYVREGGDRIDGGGRVCRRRIDREESPQLTPQRSPTSIVCDGVPAEARTNDGQPPASEKRAK
ncbi:hypothetical protein GCM10011509_09670 [Ornithinimicrobium pekingense]|uniref:Uncharacterized protein n=1 Tax=Ornithinimicrobium pekingense TaxID=384677 RepID=A0ABQ2F6C8_9MICO|nr:hypothetical protein GCM10011509_09670 [Ornithinimicrobium pekingense]